MSRYAHVQHNIKEPSVIHLVKGFTVVNKYQIQFFTIAVVVLQLLNCLFMSVKDTTVF